uniref:Uncharacterized protein n=1 Tax=viral metagenome TaxID=1070528 RepID=A0A6C0J4C4_9ZZZZ
MIRVGRIKNCNGKTSYPGYKRVIVMTKSSKYGSLSPYLLTDGKGRIMENLWQFSKVYKETPKTKQYYSQWDKTVVWERPKEIHVDTHGDLTQDYITWRKDGMEHVHAVRYPVGKKHTSKCLYALSDKDMTKKLDYITARKSLYLPLYSEMVRSQPQYAELLCDLKANRNIIILEVDGPHEENLLYYQNKYKVKDTFIEQWSMEADPQSLEIMLNDSKHNFGHGYCLAWCLWEDLHNTKIPYM